MGKEISFVPERVPITTNVKHLGLQGHVWSDGLVFATDRDGHGLYVIVPHDRLRKGPGWIMLFDRSFRIKDMRNMRQEIRKEAER